MTNIINLKAYRDARVKAKTVTIDELAKWWLAYWFALAGIK